MMTIESQALAGFRWTASVRLISQVLTWAITLVVIRLLLPADYGLLAMATVFVAFLAMFSELGLGAAIVQKSEVDVILLKRIFGVVLVVHFSLAALLFVFAPLIADFYEEPRVMAVIRVFSLQFILAGFAVIPEAQLQRKMEFRNRSLLDLSSAIVASLTTLSLAFSGAGVWALVVGSLLSQLWKTVGINCLSPFWHWPDFSVKGLQSLLRFGGNFTAVQVIWIFLSQVDILICAKFLGKEVLGFYSVAMHLASLPSQRVLGLVNQVAFPAFSRMQNDLEKMGENVLKGVRILSFFGFPALWGMSSIAPEIIEVALGPKWVSSIFPLQVLALIIPLRIIGNFISTAIQGVGRTDIVLRSTLVAAFISPALFLTGAYGWGLSGLLVAWLISAPILFLQSMARGMPALGLRLSQLVMAMLPAAISGLAMYGAVSLVRYTLMTGQASLLRLCVLTAIGAIVYGLVSLGFNQKGTRDVMTLLQNLLPAKRVQSVDA